MIAEILNHYYPNLVWTHTFVPKNSVDEKKDNWVLLRKKVLKKIKFPLSNDEIYLFVNSSRGAIENFLLKLKRFLDNSHEQIRQNIQESFMYTKEDIKEKVAKSRMD